MTVSRKDYHVIPHENGWAVHRTGSERASKTFPKPRINATAWAVKQAVKNQRIVYIHGEDGRIEKRWSWETNT